MTLNSPHCVRVFGFERFDGHPCLVMEYIEGVSLLGLTLSCRLQAEALKSILVQIRSGLLDLRQKGLCHGDLSPSNVLIDRRGLVKLIDFGISNMGDGRYVHATPEFVDPRVLRGQPMSFETDLYSLVEIARFCTKFCSDSPSLRDMEKLCRFGSRALWKKNSKAGEKLLGRMVREYKEKLPSRLCRTSSLRLTMKSPQAHPAVRRRVKNLTLAMSMILGLLLPATSVQSNSKSFVAKRGILQVRTMKWYRVQVNEGLERYTPFSLPVAEGKVVLKWKRNKRSYQRALTIQAGENIVLNDSFFDSPDLESN